MAADLQELTRTPFAAADQQWTNSNLRPDQYAQPILALGKRAGGVRVYDFRYPFFAFVLSALLVGCVSRETSNLIAEIKGTGVAFDCRLAAEDIANELDADPVISVDRRANFLRRLGPCRKLGIPPGSDISMLIQHIEGRPL